MCTREKVRVVLDYFEEVGRKHNVDSSILEQDQGHVFDILGAKLDISSTNIISFITKNHD